MTNPIMSAEDSKRGFETQREQHGENLGEEMARRARKSHTSLREKLGKKGYSEHMRKISMKRWKK